MDKVLHVYADLVGAAGVDAELNEGVESQLFLYFVVGQGCLPFLIDDHDSLFSGMLHEAGVDAAFFLRKGALDDTGIDFFYRPLFEYLREVFMHGFRFGEYDDTAGAAVQPVNGEDRTVFFFQPALEGRIFAFAVGDAEQSGGFIDSDKIFVLEYDLGLVHEVRINYLAERLDGRPDEGRLDEGRPDDGRPLPFEGVGRLPVPVLLLPR